MGCVSMELPSASQIAAIVAGIGLLAQQFGVVMPAQKTADLNAESNFWARDQLAQCHEERDKLLDKLLEQAP